MAEDPNYAHLARLCNHLHGILTTNAPLLCDFITVQPPVSNPHTPVKFSQMTPNGQIADSRILPWVPPHAFSQQAVKSTDSLFLPMVQFSMVRSLVLSPLKLIDCLAATYYDVMQSGGTRMYDVISTIMTYIAIQLQSDVTSCQLYPW